MKKVLFIIASICICCLSNAQLYLDSKTLNSEKVITPTLYNLKTLVNASVNEFKSTMVKYGYKVDPNNQDYSCYSYINDHLAFFMGSDEGIGVNTIDYCPGVNKSVSITYFRNQQYPPTCITDFMQEVSSYYVRTEGNKRLYLIEQSDCYYGIYIGINSDFKVISITKFRK